MGCCRALYFVFPWKLKVGAGGASEFIHRAGNESQGAIPFSLSFEKLCFFNL